jgi:hypothetical protein
MMKLRATRLRLGCGLLAKPLEEAPEPHDPTTSSI